MPPRLEGEQKGSVEHQRVGEAAQVTGLYSPPFEGVEHQRVGEAVFAEDLYSPTGRPLLHAFLRKSSTSLSLKYCVTRL